MRTVTTSGHANRIRSGTRRRSLGRRRPRSSAFAPQRGLLAIEERTREQIAEFLHGRVQSQLLIASQHLWRCLGLLRLDPERVETLLTETIEELDHIREREVRQVSHLLHPSTIKMSLVSALYLLTEQYGACFSVDLKPSPEVVTLDDHLNNQLPERVRLTAYRIVEEGLTNAARHAHATTVEVVLAVERLASRRQLCVEVRDNGLCSGDASAYRPRLGLTCIETRVEQAGGRWRIKRRSDSQHGTVLTAWLPIT
jgi:signal transduction histidine kinase